jgi:predicted lipoprotein with Yx(FWY)xxD motif
MMSNDTNKTGRARGRSRLAKTSAATTTIAVIAAVIAAMAFASSTVAIDSASNSTLGEHVLVNSQGRTLYVLSPETAHHLLCTSSECLKFWPPLTISSTKEKIKLGSDVHGKVGWLKRSNGTLQVTLNGLPLYRFAEDKANGEVNGQNFKGFGGVWHVLGDSGKPSSKALPSTNAPASSESSSSSGTTTSTSTSTSSSGSGGYGY